MFLYDPSRRVPQTRRRSQQSGWTRYRDDVVRQGRLLKHKSFVLLDYRTDLTQPRRWRFLYILTSPHFKPEPQPRGQRQYSNGLIFYALEGLPTPIKTNEPLYCGDAAQAPVGPMHRYRFDETQVVRKHFYLRNVVEVVDAHGNDSRGQQLLHDHYLEFYPFNTAWLSSNADHIFNARNPVNRFRPQRDPNNRWERYRDGGLHTPSEWYNQKPGEPWGRSRRRGPSRSDQRLRRQRHDDGTIRVRKPRLLRYKGNARMTRRMLANLVTLVTAEQKKKFFLNELWQRQI